MTQSVHSGHPDHQTVIAVSSYRRVAMGQKLHTAPDVQLLLNTIMSWAETELRSRGHIPALAAWLPLGAVEAVLRPSEAVGCSIQGQEEALSEELRQHWQRGGISAAALVAPVLYGKAGSGERSQAVRLHIEDRQGYCADLLMPYRIRITGRWRGTSTNRVHFSHPVAQESDSRFSGSR